MPVFVLSCHGDPLTPTDNGGKVRTLLKTGYAIVVQKVPFTIQLTYETGNAVPDMEYCSDVGARHVGISIKSDTREFVSLQADMLPDEKKKHDARRKYRRTRRNRLRYRAPRFNNRTRTKPKGWLAPSIQHIVDNQVNLCRRFLKICPVKHIYLEMGKFDTQALEAIENAEIVKIGKNSTPEQIALAEKQKEEVLRSLDYQHGPRYQQDTLRAAVFARDNYTCLICGRSSFTHPGLILREHHVLYWKGDHTNRLGALATVCIDCHTPANHDETGPLWGQTVKSTSKVGAAYMNSMRWKLYNTIKDICQNIDPGIEVHITYGAVTKRTRLELDISKSHVNDAYCIGRYHPESRCDTVYIEKCRRNNRILEKFYDAQYIDKRDNTEKSGEALSCGRTNRSEPRNGEKNKRIYRGEKVSKGHRNIRRSRYEVRPGQIVYYQGKPYVVKGVHNKGTRILLYYSQDVNIADIVPNVSKDGTQLPLEVDQKVQIKGKKSKYKILRINNDIITLRAEKSVKIEEITYDVTYQGWKIITGQSDA